MLANRIIVNACLKKKTPTYLVQVATCATGGFHNERLPIGKREWVCYGINSTPNYQDRVDVPMPAVRFMEITGDLLPLKEKEKGDWKSLSIEEKKKLYRASFRQTLAEVYAPTGEWKSLLGLTLVFVSVGVWLFILEKMFLYEPLPETFSEERRAAQFRRLLEMKAGHLTGLSSKWDYEKDDWKK